MTCPACGRDLPLSPMLWYGKVVNRCMNCEADNDDYRSWLASNPPRELRDGRVVVVEVMA